MPLRLHAQDCQPRVVRRTLHVRRQAALHPRPQTLHDAGEAAWRAIGRDHDLLAVTQHVVERVEELLLKSVLPFEELHVVDEQDVSPPIAVAERLERAIARLHEVITEALGGREYHRKSALVRR